ncbi:MAG: carbohydrate binding domain-containing protein [Candidatus Thorarchaeota archaeon]
MAASRDDLLKGADYEGYEAFCDTLINYLKNNWYMSDPRTNLTQAQDGMIVVDSDDGRVYYMHDGSWYSLDCEVLPKERGINLLINSGFGVWSQSDDNKGLGTLNFDSGSVEPQVGETLTGATSGAVGKVISVTVTGGTWGGGNAAGSIELGACTGRFNDNEDVNGSVGGANMLTVNQPDTGAGVDLVQNGEFESSTNGWAVVNGVLASVAGGKVGNCLRITETAGASPSARQDVSVTPGKIYKILLYVKVGTESEYKVAIYDVDNSSFIWDSGVTTATGAWTIVSHIFEVPSGCSTINIRLYNWCPAASGNTFYFDEVSLYEITPCCTEADENAFDHWAKDTTADIYRQHNDGGTYTKDGSFYALKFVPTAAGDWIAWSRAVRANAEFYQQFAGRIIALGCWVKTSTASHARLWIYDGSNHYSSYHSGGGDWEWLEVSVEVSGTVTDFQVLIVADQAPAVDGSTIVYISQPMLVLSAIIGEGNYQFRDNEVIWLEKAITSNQLESYTGQGSQGPTVINLEADTEAMLPKGAKSIVVTSEVHDSASQNNDTLLKLSKSAAAQWVYYNDPSGKANDKSNRVTGWQPLDDDGDYCFEIVASGAASFDVDEFRYHAVQVTS